MKKSFAIILSSILVAGLFISCNGEALERLFDMSEKYDVSVLCEHGTATIQVGDADPTSETTQAAKGTSILFKATPEDGYEFDYWEVVSDSVDIEDAKTDNPIAVTMPKTELILKAHFKGSNVPVTGVSLDLIKLELEVGGNKKINATVAPENATNKNVTWSSSDESIASVDTSGNVTAKASGTATITAKTVDGNKTATCTVTVSIPTYTVTFNMQNHGTQIAPLTNVSSGSTISAPESPEAEGYTFTGWYKEAACVNEWEFDTDTVTADTTLYACWQISLSSILNTVSFPTWDKTSQAGSNLWKNGDVVAFVNTNDNALVFKKGNVEDAVPSSAVLNSSGNNWACKTSNGAIVTFNMTEGVLTSITVSDYPSGSGKSALEGTYLDIASFTMLAGKNWFGKFSSTTSDKKEITSISFSNSLPQGVDKTKGVDLTEKGTKNVKGYIVKNGEKTYSIYIVGDYIFGNTDCSQMFYDFQNLATLDLDDFNTSNVTNMSAMFYGCSSLTTLDLDDFNTSNVTNMSAMFYGCSSLTTLDLDDFNTSNVTDMGNMFNGCSTLSTLSLSILDTSSVTKMNCMFKNCSSLEEIKFGNNFKTSAVTNMSSMFYGCSSLKTLDLKNFSTSAVTDMSSIFQDCSSLKTLDLENFSTSAVTNMSNMFYRCSSLEEIKFGNNFKTSAVTNMSNMFYDCSSLKTLDLENFSTSAVTNMVFMFYGCSSLTTVKVCENEEIEGILGSEWKYVENAYTKGTT